MDGYYDSIRTRQSVVTAATSGGHNSGFPSPKYVLPAPTPAPSQPAFSNKRQQPRQGTWFDVEDDFGLSSKGQVNNQPVRPSYYFQHRSTARLGGVDSGKMTAPATKVANRPPTPFNFQFSLPSPSLAGNQRPPTPPGPAFTERPRLVDIPPVFAVPQRRSPLKRDHGSLRSTRSLQHRWEYVEDSRDELSASHGMHPDDSQPLPPPRRSRKKSRAEAPRAEARRAKARRGKTSSKARAWFDSVINKQPPSVPHPLPPSQSTPGFPLPPKVIETLRISLSCFPETMLLTSSLTIETIRSYSRKLKHGVGNGSTQSNQRGQTHYSNDDRRSGTTLAGPSTRQPKPWELHKLVSSHSKDNKGHRSSRRQKEIKLPTNSSTLDIYLDPQHQPIMPDWAVVKRIFPNGSDYLCDAVYAHVLVYNYLGTIRPPTLQSQPLEGLGRNQAHNVPKKAASILGMRPSEFLTLYQPSDTNPDNISLRSGGRPAISGHGSGGIDTTVIRDLQAGLTRCIGLLVSTIEKGIPTGSDDTTFMAEEQQLAEVARRYGGGSARRGGHVDPSLLRALCEVVRASEGTEEGRGGN